MTEFNIFLAIIGGIFVVTGLFSRLISDRASFFSIPMVSFLGGILFGPGVLNVWNPGSPVFPAVLEEYSRVVLAIALMDVAFRLSWSYARSNWRPVSLLLATVMPLMFAVSGLLACALTGLPFWPAMLLGAALTPTDPVIASGIVNGKTAEQNVPDRLRHLISAESGANDGLAYVFVLLPLIAMTLPPAEAAGSWFLEAVLRQVAAAGIAGALIGTAAAAALNSVHGRGFVDRPYLFGYSSAIALIALGTIKLMGSDGIFGVFVAGIFMERGMRRNEEEESHIREAQRTISEMLNAPLFLLLGLSLPWTTWAGLPVAALLLPPAVLLFRRIPAMLLLHRWIGPVHGIRDALFAGWFGPIGISSLFYILFCVRKTGDTRIWDLGTLIIAWSLMIHGATATWLTKRYGSAGNKE